MNEGIELQKQELYQKYGNKLGYMLRPKLLKRIHENRTTDELEKYRIYVGNRELWNFSQYLEMPKEIDLQRLPGYQPRFSFLFSGKLDADNRLQSEHCFFTGRTGQGKTNLSSLMAIGFPRRPNPTLTLWVAQKAATAKSDMAKVFKYLDNMGMNHTTIDFEEASELGKLPMNTLNIGDINTLFKFSAGDYTHFQSVYQNCMRYGKGIAQALNEFVATKRGEKYAFLYDSLIYGNYYAANKKEDLKLLKNHTYCLDLSKVIRNQSKEFVDVLTNSACDYFYNFVSDKRNETAYLKDEPSYVKKQWQGLILFDEFYQLARTHKLERTMKTVEKIATQGRQEGTSLVLATQTIERGQGEKVAIGQAHHIMQFKPSGNSDVNYIIRTMGWEKTEFEPACRDIITSIFPPSSDEDTKGKALLFSKETEAGGTGINCVRLKLLKDPTVTDSGSS